MEMLCMQSENNITLMRVENGWLIRTENHFGPVTRPLRVASTPAGLADLVLKWATEQEATAATKP